MFYYSHHHHPLPSSSLLCCIDLKAQVIKNKKVIWQKRMVIDVIWGYKVTFSCKIQATLLWPRSNTRFSAGILLDLIILLEKVKLSVLNKICLQSLRHKFSNHNIQKPPTNVPKWMRIALCWIQNYAQ